MFICHFVSAEKWFAQMKIIKNIGHFIILICYFIILSPPSGYCFTSSNWYFFQFFFIIVTSTILPTYQRLGYVLFCQTFIVQSRASIGITASQFLRISVWQLHFLKIAASYNSKLKLLVFHFLNGRCFFVIFTPCE